MEIIKIISEHKGTKLGREGWGYKVTPIPYGMKRVMAIVKENGQKVTRHINIPTNTRN